MADAVFERPASRPLSEISENGDRRRVSARVSSYSSSVSLKGTVSSRPASEVRDDSKRISLSLPVHTITLNLADYSPTPSPLTPAVKTPPAVSALASPANPSAPAPTAVTVTAVAPNAIASAASSDSAPSALATVADATATMADESTPKAAHAPSAEAGASSSPASPVSPSKRKSNPPPKPSKPAELSGQPTAVPDEMDMEETIVDLSEAQDGISPLFMAARASLRPTPLGGATPIADKAPSPSPPLSAKSSLESSPRSSVDLGKPTPRAKSSWLKRASMTPALRATKSRSPRLQSVDLHLAAPVDLPPEPVSPHFSTPHPPTLPPRKFPAGPMDAAVPAAGPSRPPQHPARETVSHHTQSHSGVRSRWAWGGNSNHNTSTVTRSSSSNSIMSTSSSAHQRLPSSAQRVLGQAGNAVSKTWWRARGVGTSMSISNLGAVAGHNPLDQPGSPGRSPGTLARKLSRDELSSVPAAPLSGPLSEESFWQSGVMRRKPREPRRSGRVFGRNLELAGRVYGVFDANDEARAGETELNHRRRQCLPAVAIRCAEYLQMWGPKEEGIFRISGRSSHIARLRKDFDAGADIDLVLCDPSDLDPHAVAGIYKTYLRELPDAMLTPSIEARLDEFLYKKELTSEAVDRLVAIIGELSSATWFLLSDIIMLIDLIPRHADVNRMSHNALMISLGPTLRLSGELVTVLVRHRDQVFATPPELSARDLTGFGDDDDFLPLVPVFDEAAQEPPMSVQSLGRRNPPRLSKKPSFGNLLGSRMRRSQTDLGLASVSAPLNVPAPVPRVTLPESISVSVELPPPTFGVDDIDETEELSVAPVKATDLPEDSQYAPGTVAARARVYSTPIADRFRRSSTIDSLRAPPTGGSNSMASSVSSTNSSGAFESLSAPVNPIRGLRRSPPIYFQSSGMTSATGVTGTTPPTTTSAGVKRKDKDEAGARDGAKRLSAGPGVLGDGEDEVMREP